MSVAPAREVDLGAADDFVENDRHRRQRRDQTEQALRLKALGEQRREIADARGRHVELGQHNAKQHARHAQPHAREEAWDHVRKDHIAEHLPAIGAHRLGAGQQDRLEILHAGHDGDDNRKNAVADAESNFGSRADAEEQNEQRQDRHLRGAVEQQNDRHEAAARKRLQPDTQADHQTDHHRHAECERQFPKRDLYCTRHALGGEQIGQRRQHGGRRRHEQRIDPPARRDLPQQKHRSNDAEPGNSGMAQHVTLEARPPRHHRLLPRASSEETAVLRIAAIATTKAM